MILKATKSAAIAAEDIKTSSVHLTLKIVASYWEYPKNVDPSLSHEETNLSCGEHIRALYSFAKEPSTAFVLDTFLFMYSRIL